MIIVYKKCVIINIFTLYLLIQGENYFFSINFYMFIDKISSGNVKIVYCFGEFCRNIKVFKA